MELTYSKMINMWTTIQETTTQETATALESAQNMLKIMVISRALGGNGRWGRRWIDPPSTIKDTATTMARRWIVCRGIGHLKKDCSKAQPATCKSCRMKGHQANVCMADWDALYNKTFGRSGRGLAKGQEQ